MLPFPFENPWANSYKPLQVIDITLSENDRRLKFEDVQVSEYFTV